MTQKIRLDVEHVRHSDMPRMHYHYLPVDHALYEVQALLRECFWPLDVRGENLVDIIQSIRDWNFADAAERAEGLDWQCRFFLTYALSMYGLRFVIRFVPP